MAGLRYYNATFTVRKCVSLFYKINTCLQKTATWIADRTNIICEYSMNFFFFFFPILGMVSEVLFMFFQKLQFPTIKKF